MLIKVSLHLNKGEQEAIKGGNLLRNNQDQGISTGDNLDIWVYIIYAIQIDSTSTLKPNIREEEMITETTFAWLRDKRLTDRIC